MRMSTQYSLIRCAKKKDKRKREKTLPQTVCSETVGGGGPEEAERNYARCVKRVLDHHKKKSSGKIASDNVSVNHPEINKLITLGRSVGVDCSFIRTWQQGKLPQKADDLYTNTLSRSSRLLEDLEQLVLNYCPQKPSKSKREVVILFWTQVLKVMRLLSLETPNSSVTETLMDLKNQLSRWTQS